MAEPDQADELYALPLAEFTAARNALAARLRKQGDRPASDAVKALAKPSITAWALNQVARRQPALVEHLVTAGQDLARAQERLLAGRGQAEFREAGRAEKQAAGQLVQAAAALLAETERPPGKSVLDRLEATARAAATDSAGAELLRAGRLAADLDPTGFGDVGGFGLPAAPIPFPRERRAGAGEPEQRHEPLAHTDRDRSPRVPGSQPPERQPSERATEEREEARRREQLTRLREDVRRLQQELQALRKEAGDAEGEAARARQAASKADRSWAEARDAAARTEKAAAGARRAEEDAAEGLAAIRARLDGTADDLERAEAELRELRR